MKDFARPPCKYWLANGVYNGAVHGYPSIEDLIEPIRMIAVMPAGFRNVFKGVWDIDTESIGKRGEAGQRDWETNRRGVEQGQFTACAIVTLVAHPRPGDDYGVAVTIGSIVKAACLEPADGFDVLPGMHNLVAAVVRAVRSKFGLSDSDYVRPEPTPAVDPPADPLSPDSAFLDPSNHAEPHAAPQP